MTDGSRSEQRRRFFRQNACAELVWGESDEEAPLDRPASIIDISGSGLSMQGSGTRPALGDWIAMSVRIPGSGDMVLIGEVTREIARSEGDTFSVAVEFLGITEKERDTIVEFVCREQAKEIRMCKVQSGYQVEEREG